MPGPGKGGAKGVARPSGGTRSSFGGFNEGQMEQQAVQEALQDKALSQQSSLGSQQGSAGGQAGGAQQMLNQMAKQQGKQGKSGSQAAAQQKPARPIGSIKEELFKRPIHDVGQELKKFADLNSLLGIDVSDSPEEKVRKQKMNKRWQKLTEEEQQVAQEKYQKELKEKQEEERRKKEQEKMEAQKKQQSITPPTSPKKGPGLFMMGNKKGKKGKAMSRLQQQRQTMGTVQGAN